MEFLEAKPTELASAGKAMYFLAYLSPECFITEFPKAELTKGSRC